MNILRWILMVPGAFVAMMIGSLLGGMVLGIFGNQLSMDTASAFLGIFTFLYVAGLIVPSKKRGTTLVFLIIISVLGVAQIAISVATGFEVLNDLSPLRQILIPAGQIFGALISKLIFDQSNPKNQAGAARIRKTAGCALVIAYPALAILGLVIHVWSIVIAFGTAGLVGAVVTLCLPVFAEVFWFFKVWSMAGTVWNQYCLAIFGWIACWILICVGALMGGMMGSTEDLS